MTITLTKTKLAVAILAVAMLVPTTAYAFHVFDDVPDDAFYAAPVEWAFDNEITTGKSPTMFAPLDNVTRGESVTFLKRYDDNIVQPALTTLTTDVATNTAAAATNAADIAALDAQVTALDTREPFAVASTTTTTFILTGDPQVVETVTVVAPADGMVVLNSLAMATHTTDGGDVTCGMWRSDEVPANIFNASLATIHNFERASSSGDLASISGTAAYAVSSGETVDFVLACEENPDGGRIFARTLTGIFTPDA